MTEMPNTWAEDNASANNYLKATDQAVSLARYALNREDITGNEWQPAPNIDATLKAIDKATELLAKAKSILSNY
jgi:hypothetical protein